MTKPEIPTTPPESAAVSAPPIQTAPEPIQTSTPLSEPIQSTLSTSVDASPAGIDALSTPTTTVVDALDPLTVSTTQLAALASYDYSHLFSWFWPSGLFLRIFSATQHIIQDNLHITAPLLVITVAVLIPRIPLSVLQFRAQRATARFLPYQDEWAELMKKLTHAKAENDTYTHNKVAMRMMDIKNKTQFNPLAALPPAIGLMFFGIGSFLGLGRLVIYHREVVEMGGAGPLAYPGGLFGTGILENLTEFSPALLVALTAITWWNVRRSGMDAPKFTKWQARLPALLPPVTLVFGVIAHFSSAQMMIAMISISYNIVQSYLLRNSAIRKLLDLESVPLGDPKSVEFTPFISAWRESWKDFIAWNLSRANDAMEIERRKQLQVLRLRRATGTATKEDLNTLENPVESKPASPQVLPSTASRNYSHGDSPPPPRPIHRPAPAKKQKVGNVNRKFSTVAHRALHQSMLPNSLKLRESAKS
ncbi:hypothetical protein FS842_005283 [Serendipita sp. 407]|nr:hypothetical protein FS842_005283 [Serendipita sp. 407]